MSTHLRGYAIALLILAVLTVCRIGLIPVIGYRSVFGFLLIGVWVCGKYAGFGPSILALVAGAVIGVVLRSFDTTSAVRSLDFQFSVAVYLLLGSAVIFLCRSEHATRQSLLEQLAERKSLEEGNRATQSRLEAIVNNASAVIYVKDVAGRYVMINRRFEELFRVTQQQIIGQTDADIFPSETGSRLQANDRLVIQSGGSLEFEEVVPHDEGPHTYVSVKFPIFDSAGRVTAVGGISTDISDRTKALEALKVEQEILRETIALQDQERKLVAYEIHDGLVQYATGGLMQLESIHEEVPDSLKERIGNVVSILRKTVDEGRRIIAGIHATVLDDHGVVPAIQQLIEDEERAHIQVEFVPGGDLGRMERKTEEAIYRITQEALTNFYKHSQGDKVRIALGRSGDRVHLEIRDWGVGLKPQIDDRRTHGLRGMTERAKIAGGTCTIQSAHGGGTKVVVDLPYLCKTAVP